MNNVLKGHPELERPRVETQLVEEKRGGKTG